MLSFKFGADGSEYSKGLDKMRKDTKEWAGSVKGMIGGAIGVTALVTGFQKITESAKELNKQAKLFDVSTTTIQKFGAAAEQAGFTFDNLADAMHDMTEKAQDAANGNQNYADAFTMMGMKAEDFMNLPFEEKVKAFGDGLKYAGDQGLEFLAANELAGGAAQELIGTFKDGGAAFFEYADGINTVSDANIKAALKAAEAWREVKNEMVGWSNELATGFREAMPWMKALWKTVSIKIGGGLARHQMITSHKGTWEELKKKNELLNADLAAAEEMINEELREGIESNKEKDAEDPETEPSKSGKKPPTAKQLAALDKIAKLEKDIAAAKEKSAQDQLNLMEEEIMLEKKLAELQEKTAAAQAAYLDTYSGDEDELKLQQEALELEKETLKIAKELAEVSAKKQKVDKDSNQEQKDLIKDDKKARADLAQQEADIDESNALAKMSDQEKLDYLKKKQQGLLGGTDEERIEGKGMEQEINNLAEGIASDAANKKEDAANKAAEDEKALLESQKIDGGGSNLISSALQSIGGGGGFSMLGDPQLDEVKKTNSKLDTLIANTTPAGGSKEVEI